MRARSFTLVKQQRLWRRGVQGYFSMESLDLIIIVLTCRHGVELPTRKKKKKRRELINCVIFEPRHQLIPLAEKVSKNIKNIFWQEHALLTVQCIVKSLLT